MEVVPTPAELKHSQENRWNEYADFMDHSWKYSCKFYLIKKGQLIESGPFPRTLSQMGMSVLATDQAIAHIANVTTGRDFTGLIPRDQLDFHTRKRGHLQMSMIDDDDKLIIECNRMNWREQFKHFFS